MAHADTAEVLSKFVNCLRRYEDAAAEIETELRPYFGEKNAALSAVEQEFVFSELDSNQKRRVSQILGRNVRQRLEAARDEDGGALKIRFTPEAYVDEARPQEKEITHYLRDWAQSLRDAALSDIPTRDLNAGVRDFVSEADQSIAKLDPGDDHQLFIDGIFAALDLANQDAELPEPERNLIRNVIRRRKEQAALLDGDEDSLIGLWRKIKALPHLPFPEQTDDHSGGHTLPDPGPVRMPEEIPPPSVAVNGGDTDTRPHRPETHDGCGGLVDAVTRLSEGGGVAMAGVAGGVTPSDFSAALDKQIYAAIGLPNLRSESALALDRRALVTKLTVGLERVIVRKQSDSGGRFEFNPVKARTLSPADGGDALGAQGVVAETVLTLKPAAVECLHRLRSEICHCSQSEADDIISDIERALTQLSTETRSSKGVYFNWATSLIDTIANDFVALLSIYGIRAPLRDAGPASLLYEALFDNDRNCRFRLFIPTVPNALRDYSVGYLAREANGQAVRTFFDLIRTIFERIYDLKKSNSGAVTARLRAVVEAIPPAVDEARRALGIAGLNEADRNVEYGLAGTAKGPIDLARLLDWTEASANDWRVKLLETDLNARDIKTFVRDFRPLADSYDQFPWVGTSVNNANPYALGQRQLNEVSRHVRAARDLGIELQTNIGA
jgi:hypothetical protein